jgi:hypothetical protein
MNTKRIAVVVGLVLGAAFAATTPSLARNDVLMLSIADAMKDPVFADRVPASDVTFYFATQQPPKLGTSLGDVEVKAKRKKLSQTDEYNCRMALMAVLDEIHDRAIKAGGNAVGNIVSYYRKQPSGTETQYQCNAGGSGGVVWLKGTILKVDK